MERLTEQGLKIVSNNNGFEKTWIEKVYNKLSNLEDIEEELGIDLITLFKAIEKGIFVNTDKMYNSEFVKKVLDKRKKYKPNFDFIDKDLEVEDFYGISVHLKDYGKTWALTKEELEGK